MRLVPITPLGVAIQGHGGEETLVAPGGVSRQAVKAGANIRPDMRYFHLPCISDAEDDPYYAGFAGFDRYVDSELVRYSETAASDCFVFAPVSRDCVKEIMASDPVTENPFWEKHAKRRRLLPVEQYIEIGTWGSLLMQLDHVI